MKELIKKLVEAAAPSGYEKAIRDIILSEAEGYADEARIDALGNLIICKGSKREGGRRIMLAAHMDEIGVMATHIDEKGFIRYATIGGVYPQTCFGARVIFTNGVQGVIGAEYFTDYEKMPKHEKMYIDVGATSRDSCPVKIGDTAVFDRPFLDLGKRIVAKAMDDRVAVAVMIAALKEITDTINQIYFVFTVQEEVGIRGATTATFGLDPDIGLAVDVTDTGDTPKGIKMAVELGKGPAIKVLDDGIIVDRRVVDWMSGTAEKYNIPYQYEVLDNGATDAAAMHISRAGVPSGCLSIPTRYIHMPSEMVDMGDIENSVRLLVQLIGNRINL